MMPGEVAVVVVAAGRGTRVGGDAPKQYRPMHGAPVITHTLRLFATHPQVGMVQPVIHRDDMARFGAAAAGLRLRQAVFGGATRQISVWAGMTVSVFAGESANVKLTTEEDFARVAAAEFAALGDVRTATGYDVHSFGDGDHVWLGGVRIPHGRGLTGYSDADAPLHAVVDAILGALADGDIGSHFPPGDPQWKGASSDRFLAFAAERVRKRGGRIAHLDITIICEAPRIGPHRDAMRARIAAIAGVDLDRVAVKATTNEKLGFIGRSEGIAAMATATIRLPTVPR